MYAILKIGALYQRDGEQYILHAIYCVALRGVQLIFFTKSSILDDWLDQISFVFSIIFHQQYRRH